MQVVELRIDFKHRSNFNIVSNDYCIVSELESGLPSDIYRSAWRITVATPQQCASLAITKP